ncbi:hypothetical protein EV715DRAFT_215383, partial [Schizophyllum commune]
LYGERISGVTIRCAFSASTNLMCDMHRCIDTDSKPYDRTWGVNCWLSARFGLLCLHRRHGCRSHAHAGH